MIGLPSLRALDRTQGPRIWLAVEATDMRCGFDRLAEQVRAVVHQDPLSDSLFIFPSRRGVWILRSFLLCISSFVSEILHLAPRTDQSKKPWLPMGKIKGWSSSPRGSRAPAHDAQHRSRFIREFSIIDCCINNAMI